MIPKVAQSGQSFAGAGQYYLHDKADGQERLSPSAKDDFKAVGNYALHDKADRRTAYRVGFTTMLNMQADTPHEAIDQMSASFDRYREREKNKRGRKLTKPVYVYSLSWAPDQTPDQTEMLSAAHSSLKALRLEGLQTLIVQHTDEPQPHIHVIVNRIELDGSRARNIAFDQLRFSRWAEQYERDHGGIRCEQRVRNNELRRQGIMVKDTKSLTRTQYTAREANEQKEIRAWRQQQNESSKATDQFDKLYAKHASERRTLDAKTENRIASDRAAAAEKFRPRWRVLYRHQAEQMRMVVKANKGGLFERACFVFANRDFLQKAGKLRARDMAWLALSPKALRKRVDTIHRGERAALSQWERKLSDGAARIALREHAQDLQILRSRQQLEMDVLAYSQKVERENAARARAEAERVRAQSSVVLQPPEPSVNLAPPQLSEGASIKAKDIEPLLRDGPELKQAFSNAAVPTQTPDPVADMERRMAAFKQANPKRDFGRHRGR